MFTLSGAWWLVADPRNAGREHGYPRQIPPDALPAPVPGVVQQVFPSGNGVFWYYHRFTLPALPAPGQRALLRFGMVDYLAEVWVDGVPVGGHEGSETPFVLDMTAALSSDAEHLLAVRVLNPGAEPIDGIVLAETPHRNKVIHERFTPGSSINVGGILLPVMLDIVPAVHFTDVCTRPDPGSGRIHVIVTLQNDTETPVRGQVLARVAPAAEGASLDQVTVAAEVPPGQSEHALTLTVPQPRRWDIDDPFLYRVTVELAADAFHHDQSVRCGFRDFRLVDGFFHLNGRRLFLRSTHTGNHCPIGQLVPQEPDLLLRDLLMAKVSGYNTVRFIAGIAYPEQLDFCDEIGLLVYQENLASWCLADSPQMVERFDRSFREMILRDRNHPSVTIWGVLNETPDGPVFRQAVEELSTIRALDPTRLVLLGSGRWDREFSVGSASNPGSLTWEHVWGKEDPAAPAPEGPLTMYPGGYVQDAGDAHVYTTMPESAENTRLVRTLGAGSKPVFLSEYGIGSQFNVIDELRHFEQAGAWAELPDVALIRSEQERFLADLQRYDLQQVYPFPEDFLRESYRHSVRQRAHAFAAIRSNPRLCGYNLTGMLDHALTGEGMWTFWREWKPGAAECLRDGWAPLRWCLFVDPLHGEAGRPLRLEAVLANEDVLPPGDYPACFRIFSEEHGVCWEATVTVQIPATQPLAVPVLDETVTVQLPPGEYTFAACLESGGAPAADRQVFRIAAPVQATQPGTLMLLGIEESVERWLTARGFTCRPFDANSTQTGDILLIGAPDAGLWTAVEARVQAGATAIFLSAQPFITDHPLGDAVTARQFNDWLYHKDILARRHPVFAGLPAGLLDWDVYGQVVGHHLYDCRTTPDLVIAASFALGYCCQGGYDAGIIVAEYQRGKGRVILNALQLLDWVGRHPAADRLLLNLIAYAHADR